MECLLTRRNNPRCRLQTVVVWGAHQTAADGANGYEQAMRPTQKIGCS